MSSMLSSTASCCAVQVSAEATDDCTDVDQTSDSADTSDSCCEGSACDCTCCIHISLFNTGISSTASVGEVMREYYGYSEPLTQSSPFGIFHPPLDLI